MSPIDDSDSNEFRTAVGKVRRLKYDKVPSTGQRRPVRPRRNESGEPAQAPSQDPRPGRRRTSPPLLGTGDVLSYVRSGYPGRLLKRLRRGEFKPEAYLDLHGLSSHAARAAMAAFLDDCTNHGLRCVRIVHGKGYRSADGHAVLKENVDLWLKQRHDVTAFCSATRRDGGTGAVYVLLRQGGALPGV